jgi:hypothetical protein
MKWIACPIIQKLVAKDVCQVEDGLVFGVISFRSGDVCLDTVDLLVRPLVMKVSGTVDKRRFISSPSAVPSWRTPEKG